MHVQEIRGQAAAADGCVRVGDGHCSAGYYEEDDGEVGGGQAGQQERAGGDFPLTLQPNMCSHQSFSAHVPRLMNT